MISPFTFTSSRSLLYIRNEQILQSYSGSFLSAVCSPDESTISRYSTGLFGFRIRYTDKYKPEVQRPWLVAKRVPNMWFRSVDLLLL